MIKKLSLILILAFVSFCGFSQTQISELFSGQGTILNASLQASDSIRITVNFNGSPRNQANGVWLGDSLKVGDKVAFDCELYPVSSIVSKSATQFTAFVKNPDVNNVVFPSAGFQVMVLREITIGSRRYTSLPNNVPQNLRACIEAHYANQISDAIANTSATGNFLPLSTPKISSAAEPTNLVLNGDFSSNLTNWSNTTRWGVVGGKLRKTNTSVYRDSIYQLFATTVDTMYQVTYTISDYVNSSFVVVVGGVFLKERTANGTYTDTIVATKTNAGIYILDNSSSDLAIDNIIVRKIQQNRLTNEGLLIQNGNIELGGIIKSKPNRAQIWGAWDSPLHFGVDEWNWQYDQPPVSIGFNAMKRGTGVAIGALACRDCEGLSYSTVVGIGAGKRNRVGHATLFGTGAGQNVNSDAAVFGDEAGANATTYPINAHGYYSLNQSTTGLSTAMGHESFRNATTGDNTGIGYQIGLNLTTGRINGLGSQAGYHMTTGRAILIGRDAGGGQSTTTGQFTTDVEMIAIGDGIVKSSNSVMNNSISIGHGNVITEANLIQLGGTSHTKTQLYGKIGVNTASPTLGITSVYNANAQEGMHFINTSTGNQAQTALLLQAGSRTGQFRQYGENHSVWANYLGIFAPAGIVNWADGNNAIDNYTNGVLRTRIGGDGLLTHNSNARIAGNLRVGATTTPDDALHVTGDFMRLQQQSLNGTTASPTLYGLKFFANGNAAEQARIEVENSRANILQSKTNFLAANTSGTLRKVLTLDGATGNTVVENTLEVKNLQAGATTDSIVTSNAGVLRRFTAARMNFTIPVYTSTNITATSGQTTFTFNFGGIDVSTVNQTRFEVFRGTGIAQEGVSNDFTVSTVNSSSFTITWTGSTVSAGEKFYAKIR